MPQQPEPALLLAIKPSHRLRAILILIHALAFTASMTNDLGLIFKLGLITIICLQGWLAVKRLKNEQYTLKYTESLGWQLLKDHDLVSIEILDSTVLTPFVIFLHYRERLQLGFRTTRAKQTRLILSDALANQDYRHLIVKLKITHRK
jgi:hypothetical protein